MFTNKKKKIKHENCCILKPKEILKCQFCNKELKRQCALGIHERTCHKNPNRRPLVNNGNGWKYANKHKKAPYGTWMCSVCSLIFNTKYEMEKHMRDTHPTEHICKFCGEKFESFYTLSGHVKGCIKNPNYENNRKAIKPKNKPMSLEQKEKLSKIMKNRHTKGKQCINYSEKACKFIDKLNEERGWNLQHALNGGEIRCGRYYLDGYDKELNIAFEYDELRHYTNAQLNILCEKDVKKMNFIKKKFNCRFFRYNEKLDLLYEIT